MLTRKRESLSGGRKVASRDEKEGYPWGGRTRLSKLKEDKVKRMKAKKEGWDNVRKGGGGRGVRAGRWRIFCWGGKMRGGGLLKLKNGHTDLGLSIRGEENELDGDLIKAQEGDRPYANDP